MFTLTTIEHEIPLAPVWIGQEYEGAHAYLNNWLIKYIPALQGVCVGFNNIRLSDARMLNESPFLITTMQADVCVFEPKPGQELVGKVVNVGSDHIGLVVHGIFNCSAPLVECALDDEIRVKVTGIEEKEGLMSINAVAV
jgi:DNA-directed RNA polymerase I subunit RPA43